ncbi:MAG: Eco57I restriction-modification methylase domain-containing protein [Candidatus Hermodarchaeota archaeon]
MQLEDYLETLRKNVFNAESKIDKLDAIWDNLALLYKNLSLKDRKNTEKRLILDIFITSLLIWFLKAFLHLNHGMKDYDEKIFDLAEQQGIIFDQTFKNRLKTIFRVADKLKIDQIDLWHIFPNLDYKTLLEEDQLGSIVQNSLPHSLRKSLAANYTSTTTAKFLVTFAISDQRRRIIDPFAGSGRLLTSLIEELNKNNLNDVICLELGELLDLAAILSVLRLLYKFQDLEIKSNLKFHLGDSFSKLPPLLNIQGNKSNHFEKSDLVIMNPPFTRYLRMSEKYLKQVQHICQNYKAFFSPQMGLHVFAMFLADAVLNPGGRIAAVLPAPTFYSRYSDGLRNFLLSKYNIRYIIGTSKEKAFSEGSDLKEILIIADKHQKTEDRSEIVTFVTLNEELTLKNYSNIVNCIKNEKRDQFDINFKKTSYSQLRQSWNWISFLEHGLLREIVEQLKANRLIQSGNSLNLRIVRGFEMYGPEFFFLPNRDWIITQEDETRLTVRHLEKNLLCTFSKEILLPALRKPGLYTKKITPNVEHYVLRVTKEQKNKIPLEYIEESKNHWQVAEKRFGRNWINHIHHQLESKKPFGHLFTVDKFGITTTGTIIHFFDEEITASKNFYLIDCAKDSAKLLAAWMSSTIFILLFLASRREIGGAFGRLQIVDYLEEPIFINQRKIPQTTQIKILDAFDQMRSYKLPSLRDQIRWAPRKSLDLAILEALNVEETASIELLEKIYNEVIRVFIEADARGKRRRGRI